MLKQIFIFFLCLTFLLFPGVIQAEMTGGSYSIPIDGFSISEDVTVSGGDYSMNLSGGDFGAGDISGSSFVAKGGFQAMDGGALDYSLDKSAIALSFGSTPLTVVATDNLIVTVTTDSLTGYSLSLTEDGNLRSGTNDIDDVSDGTVTAGSEEYGVKTSGGNGLLVADTAISGSVSVASATAPVSSSATTVIFSAAASTATKAGNYSQTLTFTITANP